MRHGRVLTWGWYVLKAALKLNVTRLNLLLNTGSSREKNHMK